MKKLSMGIFLAVITSCSQINPEAQREYQDKKMRHGIIPHESDIDTVATIKPQDTIDAESAKRGKKIYQQHCIGCHGSNGDGVGAINVDPSRPVANLRKTLANVQNFDFFVSVSYWKGNMPGWKNLLSEQQKNDLVHYIKTFKDAL